MNSTSGSGWVGKPVARPTGQLSRSFGAPEGAELHCSFCGRTKGGAVRQMVAGPGEWPNMVLICNECVDLCAEIIAEADST